MTRTAKLVLVAISALLLTAASASAATESSTSYGGRFDARKGDYRFSIGGDLGLSAVNNDVGAGPAFGLRGTFFFLDQVGVALGVSAANHPDNKTTYSVTGEGLYRFNTGFPNYEVGVMFGTGKLSGTNVPEDYTFAWGPKAAIDFAISRELPVTLGADVAVLFFDAPIGGSGTEETLTAIRPMFTAKFWF